MYVTILCNVVDMSVIEICAHLIKWTCLSCMCPFKIVDMAFSYNVVDMSFFYVPTKGKRHVIQLCANLM